MSGGGGNRVPDAVSHWVQSGINLLGVVYYLMPIKTKQKCVYYKKKQFIYLYLLKRTHTQQNNRKRNGNHHTRGGGGRGERWLRAYF